MNNAAKGKGWETEARKILESMGYTVETAINKTIFIGPGRIISVAHDFFTCWDGMAVKKGELLFYQVSSKEMLSVKIKKINGTGIAWSSLQPRVRTLILGRVQGRNRHFRLYWGPDFVWRNCIAEIIKEKK